MTKGILYYSDNRINMRMARAVRETIAAAGLPITSVTLKPTDFGRNIHLPLERSYKTMFKQIVAGLEAMTEEFVFFCEHDTLYHPSHFLFEPTRQDTFYYNGNYWFLRLTDGHAVHYDVSPLSGLCADREILLTHFKERVELIEKQGFGYYMGFEPMTHNRIDWKNKYPFEVFLPAAPNVDLCHGGNLTRKRWDPKYFRKKPKFWEEADLYTIPGWSNLPAVVSPFFPMTPTGEVQVKPKKDNSLSILIPARNEEFLGKTIENILENITGDTEVIAVLDGYSVPIPSVPHDPRVIILGYHQSIGQRAATNQAARLSRKKYVMKVDAHCSFDHGFDTKMMEAMQDDWTMVPLMKNLHAFDWVCPVGHRRYQGPSGPCTECGQPTVKDILWRAKESPKSVSYCFDPTPHFQYFGEYAKRPQGQGKISPTMSLQGSCFMMTRDKYWELNICDENFGSWGSQGIEVAVKTWLSGGQVMVNKNTWYAHMFRTQGGDFGFPYPLSGKQTQAAKGYAKDLFFDNRWEKQKRPLSWLVEKFWPVPGWSQEDLDKLRKVPLKKSA